MRTLLTCCLSLLLPLLILLSCKKEGEQLTLSNNAAFSGTLKASKDSITLSNANDNDTVLRFTWPAVNFGKQLAVGYTLQYDTPADTAGANGWGKAKRLAAGTYALSYGFTGKTLNSLLNAFGIPPGNSSQIVFRVISDVPQYNGSASSIGAVFSPAVAVKVTPYALSLYVPGDYQGWDPGHAPLLNPVAGSPGLYEGFYNITGSGQQYFKFTSSPDWDHINYGDGGSGTFSTDGNAAGLSVPDGGYYEFTADLNKNTWKATKTTWGIIGDATPGGWDNDTQMTYDPAAQVWTLTAVLKQAGSFKFRANNAWAIDFGIDQSGNLRYADNPFFPYNPNLNNLSVGADGTYTITLDLHVSGKYTYSLVKN